MINIHPFAEDCAISDLASLASILTDMCSSAINEFRMLNVTMLILFRDLTLDTI